MRFDRVFQSALAGAIAILAFAQGAFADFMLRIESVTAGTGVVITDNGSGDLNPATGVIIFNGSINGFLVNVTTGLSKPVIGGVNNYSELDLNSVNVLSVGAGTLLITLADTGFTNGPDGPASVIGNVGGTLTAPAGSLVFFNTWQILATWCRLLALTRSPWVRSAQSARHPPAALPPLVPVLFSGPEPTQPAERRGLSSWGPIRSSPKRDLHLQIREAPASI